MFDSGIATSEIQTLADFRPLADEWNACLAASPEDAVHLRHEWLLAWYGADPDRYPPRIVLAREGGRLIGGLALTRGSLSLKRFRIPVVAGAADGLTPRFAIMAAENRTDVFRALAEHLLNAPAPEGEGGALGFAFTNLAVDSEAAALWTRAWRDLGRRTYFEGGRTSPYLIIPAGCTDFEALWPRLCSRHQRRLLLQKLRRSERPDLRVEQVRTRDRALEILPALYAASARSWKGAAGTDIPGVQRARRFYDAFTPVAADRGWLNIWALWRGGTCLAFQYDLEYGGTSTALRSDFDLAAARLSPGCVLRWHMLRDFVARGGREFDFGGHNYRFKAYWTDRLRPHVRLIVPARRGLSDATLLLRNHPLAARLRQAAPEGGVPF